MKNINKKLNVGLYHNKGKSYEEIYGAIRAKEICLRISRHKKGDFSDIPPKSEWKRICPTCGKELSYKVYSSYLESKEYNRSCIECANKARRGKPSWNANKFSGTYKKCQICEAEFYDEPNRTRKYCSNKCAAISRTGLNNSSKRPEVRHKLRLVKLQKVEEAIGSGGQVTPFYNKKACLLFEKLMRENGTFIQHAENGGEFKVIGYFVDGYDKENNIVYEYDEDHHFNKDGTLCDRDIQRQRDIEDYLKCKFVRIKDQG